MQKQDELDQVNAENVPLPTDQHPWAYPMKRPATLRKRSSSKVKSVKKKTRLVHYASYEAMNLVGHIYSNVKLFDQGGLCLDRCAIHDDYFLKRFCVVERLHGV